MPILALVLIIIGGIGILIGIGTLIWAWISEEVAVSHNPHPLITILLSFMVGQVFFNAGIAYWLGQIQGTLNVMFGS